MVKVALVENRLSRNHGQPADGEASEPWDTTRFLVFHPPWPWRTALQTPFHFFCSLSIHLLD